MLISSVDNILLSCNLFVTYLIHWLRFVGSHGEGDVSIVGRSHLELNRAVRHRIELIFEVILRVYICK